MRRKDREVTNYQKIQSIILSCNCCRLGLHNHDFIYIVPLSFGYEKKCGKHFFYFHSAQEGEKIRLLKNNPNVGFEMDTNVQLQKGDIACHYSAQFQSIIGNGTVSFINDTKEKEHALQLIMYHNTHKKNWKFEDLMLETVCVFKMEVNHMSCKEHL